MSDFCRTPVGRPEGRLSPAALPVTVVMAIFEPNEDFLKEQLKSLFLQTHSVSELIISDDSHSDGARDILSGFEFPEFMTVKYVHNSVTLGYSKNFLSALDLAQGRIIFFCDQDDVWLPQKVASVLQSLEKNSQAVLVVHDQIRTDAELNEEAYSTIENYRHKGWSSQNLVHGCASAFRTDIKDIVCECPNDYQYDEWLHFVGQSINGRIVLPEALMKFRRHPQATTVAGSNVQTPQLSFKAQVDAYLTWRQQENKRKVSALRLLNTLIQRAEHATVSEQRRRAWLNAVEKKTKSAMAEKNVLFGGFGLFALGVIILAANCIRGSYDFRSLLKNVIARAISIFG